jgi:hypothetical protein
MTDYLHPQAQWQDTVTTAVNLEPWSFDYDPETGVVTLAEHMQLGHSGLTLESDDGTTKIWMLLETTNSEVETTVAYGDDGIVYIEA